MYGAVRETPAAHCGIMWRKECFLWIKGTFHPKMGSIKDRNGKRLKNTNKTAFIKMCILQANVTHLKLKQRNYFKKNSYLLHHEHYVMYLDG